MDTQKLEAALALAIHESVDVVEALPQIHDCPVEKLEGMVELWVTNLNDQLFSCIKVAGENAIKEGNPEKLKTILFNFGVKLPDGQLMSVCERIIERMGVESRFICHFPDKAHPMIPSFFNARGEEIRGYKTGVLWYVKMSL